MIKQLLGSVTTWLIAALLAFGVFQYGLAQRYAAERDTAQERVARAEERAEAMAGKQDELDTLERNDEPTRDWSAEPVPDAIGEWVRDLATAPGDPDA